MTTWYNCQNLTCLEVSYNCKTMIQRSFWSKKRCANFRVKWAVFLELQHTPCNPNNTGKVQIAFHKILMVWNNTVERKRFQRKAANFLFLSFCLFLYVSGGKKVVWAAHTSLFWPSRYAFYTKLGQQKRSKNIPKLFNFMRRCQIFSSILYKMLTTFF